MLIYVVVCLLFYAIGSVLVIYCFLPLVLREKGAESIVYLSYIYRISIVFDSGLTVTLLLFDS